MSEKDYKITPVTEEIKSQNQRYSLSKIEFDLYNEENAKPQKVVRVRHFSMPNKEERWKIFEDNKVVAIIDCISLSDEDRKFLHTVDGLRFVINKYKSGVVGAEDIKDAIKNR